MRIMHLNLDGTYTEGFSYQENLLTRYHAILGHDVVMLAINREYDQTGKIIETKTEKYINQYGVVVYRLKPAKVINENITKALCLYRVYDILIEEKPDLIFVHDICKFSLSYFDIYRYKKKINPECCIMGDIHTDMYNTPIPSLNELTLAGKLFLGFRQRCFQNVNFKICSKVYGVAPSTIRMALRFYHVPKKKLSLLPFGCDPIVKNSLNEKAVRKKIRDKVKAEDDSILIVHGGKMDEGKKTIELIDALSELKNNKIRLILFGGIAEHYNDRLMDKINSFSWISYFGHLNQTEYYELFLSADLVVFPGGQSSMWQEAVGCGAPMLVYNRDGVTAYLNRCGNVVFFETQSVSDIRKKISEALLGTNLIKMQKAAGKAAHYFSYDLIAKKIIDDYMILTGETEV